MVICNDIHTLQEIFTCGYEDHEITVVRWCENCGAVVVDIDFDGRIFPGQVKKMIFPKNIKRRQ